MNWNTNSFVHGWNLLRFLQVEDWENKNENEFIEGLVFSDELAVSSDKKHR